MSREYFYAEQTEDEYITIYDFDDAIITLRKEAFQKEETIILTEYKRSRQAPEKWCNEYNEFLASDGSCCGKINCEKYQPRNGKGGICFHQEYGLIETGLKWEIKPNGMIKKISGRK